MAQKKKVKATIVSQKQIVDQIFDLWLETELAQDAKAGQFIAVYPHNASTLLPRPISICEVDKEAFAAQVQPVVEQYYDTYGKENIDFIKEMGKDYK